jgi:adenylate kinase family enzyme
MHPLLSVPPEASSPEDKPGTMLDDAALRDYVESRGQWQAASVAADAADVSTGENVTFDITAEVESTLAAEDGKAPVSFLEKIVPDMDILDNRPVNYRLGVVVAALLDRCYRQPPLPTPPAMPEAPLRLVMSGKPFAGKRTLAARLAENYNMQVIDLDEVIRECLLLSKRPDAGSQSAIDMLSINDVTSDELCKKCEEEGNPYVRQLQEIGHELQQLLDRGEAIDDELYVHLVTTKIRSVFHDRLPTQDSQAAGCAELASEPQAASPDLPTVAEDPDLGSKARQAFEAALGDDSDEAPPPDAEAQPPAESTDAGGVAPFEVYGWCLVGFPQNSQQLQLFERFLSGWVPPSATPTPEAEAKKEEAALLVPRPYEEPPPFALVPGGYDLHIRLQAGNDEIVRRAVGRRLDPTTSLMYHLEDSPPCTKNQIIYERLVPVDDLTNSMGSLTHRMHAFDIAQPEVEGVLSYFGPFPDAPRLRDIDAEQTMEQVHDVVEEQVAMLLEKKRTQHARELMEQQAAAEEAAVAEAMRSASPESEAPPVESEEGVQLTGLDEPSKDKEVAEITAEAAEKVPEELVRMTDLPSKVESLEDRVFKLLLQEWQEMQTNFTGSIRQLFRWHRSHLSDFRRGVHGMQHRFLQFASRTDDKQALVDSFVWKFNAFSEEYPDMRKQVPTKEELHQQADDLHELLQEKVNNRKEENMAELENITTSKWIESHIQVLAAQIQHAVRLEAMRYHGACQLLSDFYYGALGAGLPELREPCPKIEALTPDEDGVAPATRLRQFVPAAEEGGEPAHWEFPFVEDLMTQARNNLFKPTEWSVPATYEKKDEVVDPKAKGKAKGRASPPPGKGAKDAPVETEPVETPPLFVDMQQALLAERVHYQYRLSVILDWALRRLRQATEASEKLFVQLRDWVLLRRKKELDSCLDLVDVIKEHIESEDLIKCKLALVDAHLHRHPNVHLQAEFVPEEPPPLECCVPYRWTINQLDQLREAVVGAAQALRPDSLLLPSQSLMTILQKQTQADSQEMPSSIEPPRVPSNWRPCDVERLQSLTALFDHPPRTSTVDAIEFLLSIGLHHSPVGWPTIHTLQEVRVALENEVPAGATWPDFYIAPDTLASLPLFHDAKGLEADLSAKFPWQTSKKPAAFDRCREQMRWLVEVFRAFQAPLRQEQAYELEVACWDNQMRIKDEDKVCTKLLDDAVSGNSTPIAQVAQPVGVDAASLTHSPAGTSEDAAPQPPPGPPPRPTTPKGLPAVPGKGAVSVRQLLTYFSLGTSLEDGLSRALALLGPSGCSNTTPVPVVDLHAALLQFGARPTPPSFQGDGQPRFPSLDGFCKEIGIENGGRDATMTLKSFLSNAQALRLCTRLGLNKRHCRAEVEKLFPKSLSPGAKILQSQRIHN